MLGIFMIRKMAKRAVDDIVSGDFYEKLETFLNNILVHRLLRYMCLC